MASATGCALSASQPAWSATILTPGSLAISAMKPSLRGGQPSNWSQLSMPTTALPPSFSVMNLAAAAPVVLPRSSFLVTRKPEAMPGSLTQVLKQTTTMPASLAFFSAATEPSDEIGVMTMASTPRVM